MEQASYVDRAGQDALVLSEHHASDDGYLTSPLLLAAAMAARTDRIPITISALLVNLYEPIRLAQDIEVLEQIGAGRVSYTFGIGYRIEEYELFDRPWPSRGADAEAHIRQVQEYLRRLGIAPMLFYGGGSRAAATQAARLGLHFQPQVTDRELADFYREECRRAGREPGLVVRPPTGPAYVFCASDPDRFWALHGHHLLADATAYQAWLAGRAAQVADRSQTLGELRVAGQYAVLTPQEAVERCRRRELRLITAHPLCGGLPEEPSWESLRLICE